MSSFLATKVQRVQAGTYRPSSDEAKQLAGTKYAEIIHLPAPLDPEVAEELAESMRVLGLDESHQTKDREAVEQIAALMTRFNTPEKLDGLAAIEKEKADAMVKARTAARDAESAHITADCDLNSARNHNGRIERQITELKLNNRRAFPPVLAKPTS
jgi:hypothetical protein